MGKKKFLVFIFVYFTFTCFLYSQKPFYAKTEKKWQENQVDSLQPINSIYLIGDAGNKSKNKPNAGLELLKFHLKHNTTEKKIILFLGDNIYPKGLPKANSHNRLEKEDILNQQLNLADSIGVESYFIAGNHDWGNDKNEETLNRQVEYVNQYPIKNKFIKNNKGEEITEIEFDKNLVALFIDSEYFLQKNSKSDIQTLIKNIKLTISKHKNKHIIIVQHHPIYANGQHGGNFSLKQHIFPLTAINKNLFVPIPIIGSLYPTFRQKGISKQDLSNKKYQTLINGIQNAIKNDKNVIITSGHEHVLQFSKKGNINQVISGSGSLYNKIFQGDDLLFGLGYYGFAKLNYYNNGQCWVEFWKVSGEKPEGELVYRKPIYVLAPTKIDYAKEKALDYTDSIKHSSVGFQFKASETKEKAFGKHFRSIWTTPVSLKYLDLTRFNGGLNPVEIVEDKNINSLILKDNKNTLYKFKYLNKSPYNLLPKGFKSTIAEDIIEDQTSTSHPFGSVVVAALAKAIGIYQNEPKIFYMPNSALLGSYLSDFGGKIGVLELYPDSLAKSKVVNTQKLYEQLEASSNNYVDEKEFLKNRLFDLLIGDFNRNEDKWVWLEQKDGEKSVFKSISKDREQFFTKIDGILPSIMKNISPEIQHFGSKIKDPAKLSIAAKNLDRNLLLQLTQKDWINIAKEIQQNLTNEKIELAVKQMPKEAFVLSGKELTNKLINRKNNLEKTAIQYFKVLHKNVKISTTNLADKVYIERKKDSTFLKIANNLNKIYFNNTYSNKTTKSIHIYLLSGIDNVSISGKSKKPITIRIIGGDNEDEIKNNAKNGKTYFYDNPNSFIESNTKTKISLSEESWINKFDRYDFEYNKAGFSPNFDIKNAKDGLSIGIIHTIKNKGFRKDPNAFEQKIGFLVSPNSGNIETKYLSTFYSLFAYKYDLIINGRYTGPAYDFNYFGLGNSTPNIDNINYYRVRSKNMFLNAFIQYRLNKNLKIGVGPGVEYYNILKQQEPNFIADITDNKALYNWFFTINSYVDYDKRDRLINPKKGWRWLNTFSYINQTNQEKLNHFKFSSSLSSYVTPNIFIPITFAFRAGVSRNFGDFQFYHASTLGNNENLSGYRDQRFSGKAAMFGNTEIRIPMNNIRSYLISGEWGIYGFYDIGKVSSDAVENKKWHQGYGPGLWVNLFDTLIVAVGYGISKEDKVVYFNTGFRF